MRRLLPLILLAGAIGALIFGASRLSDSPIRIGASAEIEKPEEQQFDDPLANELLGAGDDPLGGRVLSPAGRPVLEARVELYSQDDESWLDAVGRRPIAVLRTNRNGRFRVAKAEPGSYVVLARAEGMGEGIAVIPDYAAGQVRRVTVGLPPLVTVGGRVEDLAGRPVANAKVLISPAKVVKGFLRQAPEFSGIHLPKLSTTVTDEEGRFLVEKLPATTYDLEVVAPGMVTARVYTVTAPEENLRIIMRPGITVKGTVTWGEGAAPPGLRVWTEPEGQTGLVSIGKTAATFTVADLPPGAHVVHAWASGFGAASGDVVLKADRTAPSVDLKLIPGTPVSGRVTELYSGNPIPNARVVLSLVEVVNGEQWAVKRETAVTGSDGRYRFAPPPGRWVVRAEASDHIPVDDRPGRPAGFAGEPFVVTLGGEGIRRDLVLRGNYVIRGRVVHPDGSPARAIVRTAGATYLPGRTSRTMPVSMGRMARTDRDGYFRIDGVSPNAEFRVAASWLRGQVAEVGEVSFAPGKRVTSARELTIAGSSLVDPDSGAPPAADEPGPATVSGRVVNQRGEPVPFALVSLGGTLVNTDGEGRFQTPNVSPGKKTVRVVAASYPPTILEPVHLKKNSEANLGDLVLRDHGVRVMGTVHSIDHDPIADVRLTVRFTRQEEEFILWTDAQGRYELEGPAAFHLGVAVEARPAGFSPCRAQDSVVDTRVIDLELSPLITVLVRIEAAGSAAPAISLELRAVTNYRVASRLVRTMVPSGTDDTWVARGIPEGTYSITLRAAGYAPINLGSHRLADPAGHDLGRHLLLVGGTVTGTVVDQNKSPVAQARVWLESGEETSTDADGKFRFEHVAEGSHTLSAYGPPRRPRPFMGRGRAKVRNGKTSNVTIRLR